MLMTQWLVLMVDEAVSENRELIPHDSWLMLVDMLRGMDGFWRVVYSVDPVIMSFEEACVALGHLDDYIGVLP